MTNLYIIVFVLAAVIGAAWFVRREKKTGAACVGCAYSKQCGGSCGTIGQSDLCSGLSAEAEGME